MKKIVFAVLAVAAIASCTKNEVLPVNEESQEITFRTIVGPQTKELGTGQVEYQGNAFYSTAFFLAKGKTWAANSEDAVEYLKDKIIGSGTPKKWKATTSYYWPKGGKLTFMSYALLDASNVYVDATSSIVAAAKTGLTISSFDVNGTYKNHDLLVAAIASDKDANENVYLTEGVPTLFGHKLCKLTITAQTNALYSGKTFTITGITLNKLNHIGTYTMAANGTESWGTPSGNGNVSYFSGSVTVNNDADNLTVTTIDALQSVFLPQEFEDAETITINYTIKTGSVIENVSVTKKLSEVFGAGAKWEMNKIYNINLTFGLQEILWDPAQTDWTDGSDGSVSL
jgi:hypothetical protein